MALWTPYDHSVLPALDLDAADGASTTTIASTGQWSDLSGNDFHAQQATADKRPTVSAALNGLDVLDFDGGDHMITPTVFEAASDVTIFLVHKAASISATGDALFALQNGLDSTNGYFRALARSDLSNSFQSLFTTDSGVGGATGQAPSFNYTIDTWRVSCHYRAATVAGLSFNGDDAVEVAATGQCNFADAKGIVGCYFSETYAFNGSLARILVVPGILSAADQQKFYGYLHHRYGLAGLLPTEHPYKSAPPETQDAVGNVVALPMLISGEAVNPIVAAGNIVHAAPLISGKVWNVGLGNVAAPKMIIAGEAENPVVCAGRIFMLPKVSGEAYNPVFSTGNIAMKRPHISGTAANNELATCDVSALGKIWGRADNPKAFEVIRYNRFVQ